MNPNKTSRTFLCTKHVTSTEPWSFPKTLPAGIKYMLGQLEKGEETGALHYQFYCETEKPIRMSGLKKLLGLTEVHIEVTKNSNASRNYCKKIDTRVEGPWELKPPPPGTDPEILKYAQEEHPDYWKPKPICDCQYGLYACGKHYKLTNLLIDEFNGECEA